VSERVVGGGGIGWLLHCVKDRREHSPINPLMVVLRQEQERQGAKEARGKRSERDKTDKRGKRRDRQKRQEAREARETRQTREARGKERQEAKKTYMPVLLHNQGQCSAHQLQLLHAKSVQQALLSPSPSLHSSLHLSPLAAPFSHVHVPYRQMIAGHQKLLHCLAYIASLTLPRLHCLAPSPLYHTSPQKPRADGVRSRHLQRCCVRHGGIHTRATTHTHASTHACICTCISPHTMLK
jgi:hypothetical protein